MFRDRLLYAFNVFCVFLHLLHLLGCFLSHLNLGQSLVLLIGKCLLPDLLQVTIGLTCSSYSFWELCIDSLVDTLGLLTERLFYGFMPARLLFLLLLLLCSFFLLGLLCTFFLFFRGVCSTLRELLLRSLIFLCCFISRCGGRRWFFFLSCLLSAFLQEARERVQRWLGTVYHVLLGIYSLHLCVVLFEELLKVHLFLFFLLAC